MRWAPNCKSPKHLVDLGGVESVSWIVNPHISHHVLHAGQSADLHAGYYIVGRVNELFIPVRALKAASHRGITDVREQFVDISFFDAKG